MAFVVWVWAFVLSAPLRVPSESPSSTAATHWFVVQQIALWLVSIAEFECADSCALGCHRSSAVKKRASSEKKTSRGSARSPAGCARSAAGQHSSLGSSSPYGRDSTPHLAPSPMLGSTDANSYMVGPSLPPSLIQTKPLHLYPQLRCTVLCAIECKR